MTGGPRAFDGIDTPSARLADACVHCGFCLPACPTYLLWGEEMDSPRGRVYLIKGALENRTEISPSFVEHFDACLGCMACVPACPSGVQYGPLLERTRAQIERHHQRPLGERLLRALLFRVLPYPMMLRLALLPLAAGRRIVLALARRPMFGGLPASVRTLLNVAPLLSMSSLAARLPARTPARGEPRLRVGVLAGCVQRVVFPQVNQATVRVLAAEGCDTFVPAGQGCCGALSRHAGRLEEARRFARQTIEVFERAGVDRIVVNSAGCGSSMKEYGELLAEDPAWASRAEAFSGRVRDVSEVVVELGEPRAVRHPLEMRTVAYHDACHLAHAQGVRAPPRALLNTIPGLEVLEIGEPGVCCGSAGIYSVVQPGPAAELGERKARHIAALAPDVIASGNPGCTLQIAAACERLGFRRPVMHPIELLDASITTKPTTIAKDTNPVQDS